MPRTLWPLQLANGPLDILLVCTLFGSILYILINWDYFTNDTIAKTVHQARLGLVTTSLFITISRQILAFIARYPIHLCDIHWRWDDLKPFAYFRGYNSTFSDFFAVASTISNIAQLIGAYTAYSKIGPEWLMTMPGDWGCWIVPLCLTLSRIHDDIKDTQFFAWVRIEDMHLEMAGQSGRDFWTGMQGLCQGRGGPDGEVQRLTVTLLDRWDKDGKRVRACYDSLP
ncbi:hypothetical protein AUEXF2481DRAFT_606827 [Aureobasidium subglaciale EXF-2481]|uniref:Uncharacterized protein n=1 Tax=Aureobasidium subglaciale (strain EXF-2481) TaxID=1043005 RepID=A0A074Y2Q1_AURSE|nr:uncharacterized protein AUEXF2481DRAFT_606827 [Aureobasidium subglaciale EXF-2481]KEQ90189.1 hypothetical protein AUEXF2481DRAFT_606827 [Aureobasidium subglaciale EXF-2481]